MYIGRFLGRSRRRGLPRLLAIVPEPPGRRPRRHAHGRADLGRAADEPFEEVIYDEPREGRPSELSEEEYDQFVKALHESPEEVGLDAPAWSVPLARHYLREEFDVEYCERHVRRLLSEAGLSWKTARPEYYKSDDRAQEAWQEGDTDRTVLSSAGFTRAESHGRVLETAQPSTWKPPVRHTGRTSGRCTHRA